MVQKFEVGEVRNYNGITWSVNKGDKLGPKSIIMLNISATAQAGFTDFTILDKGKKIFLKIQGVLY